jgi:hypothetical protein
MTEEANIIHSVINYIKYDIYSSIIIFDGNSTRKAHFICQMEFSIYSFYCTRLIYWKSIQTNEHDIG